MSFISYIYIYIDIDIGFNFREGIELDTNLSWTEHVLEFQLSFDQIIWLCRIIEQNLDNIVRVISSLSYRC